jgi:hypothetical protein
MHTCITRWGLVLPLAWLLVVSTPASAAVKVPGSTIDKVDFERHIMGLLGRMGCSSGSCHGSFQGKGGMQLSLFGYDPSKDFHALVRDSRGRRLDLTNPDSSLVLLKATGQVPHGGQTRFGKSSWQYRLLREWIASGARWDLGSGTVKEVRISPAEFAFKKPGEKGQLKVEATFSDGTTEDITPLCDYRTNDDSVVGVSPLGAIESLRPGDTAIVVSYRGTVLPVRVLVPAPLKPGFTYPKVPEVNGIDREVFAKLRRLNMVPSELSSDSEFLRRVTLDTIGSLPTPEQVRAFLADKSKDKREKKIDELLAHPRHAALWATKFCDITGNNTDSLETPPQRRPYLSQMWHDWFRKRIAENMPYDQIVKGVLTATSREGRTPEDYIKAIEAIDEAQEKSEKTKYAERETLDLFWRKQQRVTIDQWGEKTAVAFLGVRLECAQCHKHPFDRWTQADYRSYANVFAPVAFAISPEAVKVFRDANVARSKKTKERQTQARMKGKGKVVVNMPLSPVREVFVGKNKQQQPLKHPETGKVLPARALGGPEIDVKPGDDPRVALFEWMRKPDNPFFARSIANRVWGHYLGVGIVHPVDDFSLANPPSNAKLLDLLASDFVKGNYNLRALEKSILMSRTYQLSAAANETNRLDKNNFSRAYVRPLMAEVVVDMLNDALGTTEQWGPGEAPAGGRAIEVGASRVRNPSVMHVFRVFGRATRTSACDCDRALEPGLPQKLYLMADPALQVKLRQPKSRLRELLENKKDDLEVLEELFLATLSRGPTAREKAAFIAYRDSKIPDPTKTASAVKEETPPVVKKGKAPQQPPKKGKVAQQPPKKGQAPPAKGGKGSMGSRGEVFVDTLWALINTTEFIFNH